MQGMWAHRCSCLPGGSEGSAVADVAVLAELPASPSGGPACVLHSTSQMTPRTPLGCPVQKRFVVEGCVAALKAFPLFLPLAHAHRTTNYRYFTCANMFGVLLFDPHGPDPTPRNEKPHFHKFLLHLDDNRPLSQSPFLLCVSYITWFISWSLR